MRKLGLPWIVVSIAVLGLALAGCSGSDGKDGATGPRGPEGPTGPVGPAGPDGPAGTVDCARCHNDNTELTAAMEQYSHALHASDAIIWEVNRDSWTTAISTSRCFLCHTSEGFVASLAGPVPRDAIANNPTQVGCRTCHTPHTTKNFALRTNAAVILQNGVSFDCLAAPEETHGKGNLCANCHRTRYNYFSADSASKTTVWATSTRFGPHSSPQAEVFRGTAGYDFGTPIPATNRHYAMVPDGCVGCHMAKPLGTTVGGHTFAMANEAEGGDNIKSCAATFGATACHAANTPFDKPILWGTASVGVQTQFDTLLAALKAKLVTAGLLVEATDAWVGPFPRAIQKKQAGAMWNYRLAQNEKSRGVHNATYILTLLQRSIDNL